MLGWTDQQRGYNRPHAPQPRVLIKLVTSYKGHYKSHALEEHSGGRFAGSLPPERQRTFGGSLKWGSPRPRRKGGRASTPREGHHRRQGAWLGRLGNGRTTAVEGQPTGTGRPMATRRQPTAIVGDREREGAFRCPEAVRRRSDADCFVPSPQKLKADR